MDETPIDARDFFVPQGEQKTITLILGAGASHPYGFPCGDGLISKILEHKSPSSGPGPERHNEAFRNDLKTSQLDSIDQFLALRREYAHSGKLSIYERIAHHENKDQIFPNSPDKNFWHRQFLREILPHGVNIDNPAFKVNIITFNYDRSLEYIWSQMLMARYGLLEEEAFRKLYGFVEVTHVYGRLPPLPGESSFLKDRISTVDVDGSSQIDVRHEMPFGSLGSEEASRLKDWWAPKFIRTIYELNEVAGAKEKHVKMISEASRVIFLGVGYHPENMAVLGEDFSRPKEGRKAFGTALGLSTVAFGRIKHAYQGILLYPTYTCSDLLEEVQWAP